MQIHFSIIKGSFHGQRSHAVLENLSSKTCQTIQVVLSVFQTLEVAGTCTSQQALVREVLGLVEKADGATVTLFLEQRNFKNRETYELPPKCPRLKEFMIVKATLPRIRSSSALAYIWHSPQTAASHTAV